MKMKMRKRMDDEKEEEDEKTIFRFKTFVTWLSTNSMDAIKKDKILKTIDFESFMVEELASVVRKSGLYPSDKIIMRMEQLYQELGNRTATIQDILIREIY